MVITIIIMDKKKEDTLNSDYTTGTNNPIDSVSKEQNKNKEETYYEKDT